MTIATRFVTGKIPPLESLSPYFEYKMMVKLQTGEQLTREEKDQLFERIVVSQPKGCIHLHGWKFDFTPYMRRIWVKLSDYGILEVYAPDKTSVRNYWGHNVIEMSSRCSTFPSSWQHR